MIARDFPSLRRGATLLVSMYGASACGPHTPPLEQPVGETHTTASSTGGARPQGLDTPSAPIGVVIRQDVRKTCGLPDEPREAPRFDFDSARLRPRGDDVLDGLARCVTSGKLGDAYVTVIGHTDARGNSDYNEQLGLYRAVAAKQYLVDAGVAASRISVESRGEHDSHGRDEPSWALDRRVEIRVAGAR
jgi:outer membrane protein OmpA-like peptidoglycan-associated protein